MLHEDGLLFHHAEPTCSHMYAEYSLLRAVWEAGL